MFRPLQYDNKKYANLCQQMPDIAQIPMSYHELCTFLICFRSHMFHLHLVSCITLLSQRMPVVWPTVHVRRQLPPPQPFEGGVHEFATWGVCARIRLLVYLPVAVHAHLAHQVKPRWWRTPCKEWLPSSAMRCMITCLPVHGAALVTPGAGSPVAPPPRVGAGCTPPRTLF